jgi:hypothetical protein
MNYEIKKVELLEAKEKRRIEKVNRELNLVTDNSGNLIDVNNNIIQKSSDSTSYSSSNISSTDPSHDLIIKSSISSLVIPAPSSKDTYITVISNLGKPYPKIIPSDNPNHVWV